MSDSKQDNLNSRPITTHSMKRIMLEQIDIPILILLCFLVTGQKSSAELFPHQFIAVKLVCYGWISFLILKQLLPMLKNEIATFNLAFLTYRRTFLLALSLYFVGLLVGALRGPDPAYALQQTFSDAVVFLFALLYFGWRSDDLNRSVRALLEKYLLLTSTLCIASLIVFGGNLVGLWQINAFRIGNVLLLNGPFNHANHMGYILMTAVLASASLLSSGGQNRRKAWLALGIFCLAGLLLTSARGAILGTFAGLIFIVTRGHRKWFLPLSLLAIAIASTYGLFILLGLPLPSFITKTSFAFRGEIWGAAIQNLLSYGPLGVGAGQAESLPGWTMHNFFLEQMGEGGVLTLLGVILWLVLPIVRIRTSRLEPRLAWCIVGMMLGLMVHGIFWGQFLNGLRILTLVYVCLWTALGTQRRDDGAISPVDAQLPAS